MAKKIKYKKSDPHHDRESQRYENPIPSREFILDILVNHGEPLKRKKIAQIFELTSLDHKEALRRRLIAMVRDCQIAKVDSGYTALTLLKEQNGTLKLERDGFGTLLGEEYTVKLNPRDVRGYYDGDHLKVRTTRYDRDGQAFGVVVETIEAAKVEVVGRFFNEYEQSYVMPLGRRYMQDIHIPKNKKKTSVEGDIVQVELDRTLDPRHPPSGKVIHVLGDPEREGIEIDIATLKFSIPNLWPRGIMAEANKFGKSIPPKDSLDRVDLSEIPFVTIDGEDAKDFDDAVYAEPRRQGGWRLYVAIADVSHYVKPGSKLDTEAENRGNSVYFPGFVIPMLPAQLSNGLCSLKPKQERLALVCEMLISAQGQVTRSKFYPAVIYSHARLTYTLVSKMLDGDARQQKKYKDILPHLFCLQDLHAALEAQRKERGAIDFDTVETQIMFDESGKIASITPTERNIAHRIIEECMLAANVSAAKFLKRNKVPTLYRVHQPPNEEKVSALKDFIKELGLSLRGSEIPTPKDYSDLIAQIQGREDKSIVQTVILRSMSQAEYAMSEDGHFGLAYPNYVHFTSPIRRYPDLIVHRQIKAVVSEAYIDREQWRAELSTAGPHCSMTERRADNATRDATMALKCHYMADKIGEEFIGKITAVTSFGLFVELDKYYVEGLVHVAALGDDYFYYEPFKHRMIGERTGKTYQLGDSLEVQLMRVDVEEKKIDLEIIGVVKSDSKGRGKGRGKGSPTGKAKAKPKAKTSGKGSRGPSKSRRRARRKS